MTNWKTLLPILLFTLLTRAAVAEETDTYSQKNVTLSKTSKISFEVQKPVDWAPNADETTVLIEPRENPDETGVLIVMAHEDDEDIFENLNDVEDLDKFLTVFFQDPSMKMSVTVSIKVNESERQVDLMEYSGKFQDGGDVKFYVLLTKIEDTNFLLVGGCLKESWAQSKEILKSVIVSIVFTSEPAVAP